MYEDIMRRPMFQNAQQRAGSGIMTGVAPVQGFDRGGSVPEYTPKFLREEVEDGFAEKAFKFLVVDPDDDLDVALATASAALMASGMAAPGAVALTAARLGIKGRKLYKALDKAQEVGKKLASPTKSTLRNPLGELEEAPGVLDRIAAPVLSNIGVRQIADIAMDPVGYATDAAEGIYGLGEDVIDTGEVMYEVGSDPELRSDLWERTEEGIMSIPTELGMANGGVASLPVYMANGGKTSKTDVVSSILGWVREKLKRGEIDEVEAEDIIKKSTGQVDEIVEEIDYDIPTKTRRDRAAKERKDAKPRVKVGTDGKPKKLTKAEKKAEAKKKAEERKKAEAKKKEERTGPSQQTKDDLKGKPEGPKQPVSTAAKPDDVGASQRVADDAIFDEKGGKGWIRRNPIKSGIAAAVTAPITVPGTLGVVDEFAGTDMATPVREAMPTVGDIAESVSEVGGRAVTGFRKGLGSEEGEEVEEVVGSETVLDPKLLAHLDQLTPKSPAQPVTTPPNLGALSGSASAQEERSKVMPNFRPFGGKIAKALLGEDEAFGGDDEGDRGFLGSVMSKLQDPKMRYQLSQAAKATEGFVPRNFATDMEEAGQEYDDMVAQREYLSAQTRDVDRTDTEKLVDYYIDSLKEADPDMSNEEASKFRLELNSLFQKQNLDSAQMQTILTIFENVPNAATAQSIFDKLNIDPSVTTAIANILRGRGQV